MKKRWIAVFVLACLMMLPGCDPGTKTLDGKALFSNTVRVELYQYDNPSPANLRIGGKKTAVFDFSHATLLGTLDESQYEDLAKEITGYETLLFGRVLNEPIGKTLVLHQSDGNMVVFYGCVYRNRWGGTRYYGECNIYDENGMFVSNLGDIESDFVDKLEVKYFDGDT